MEKERTAKKKFCSCKVAQIGEYIIPMKEKLLRDIVEEDRRIKSENDGEKLILPSGISAFKIQKVMQIEIYDYFGNFLRKEIHDIKSPISLIGELTEIKGHSYVINKHNNTLFFRASEKVILENEVIYKEKVEELSR